MQKSSPLFLPNTPKTTHIVANDIIPQVERVGNGESTSSYRTGLDALGATDSDLRPSPAFMENSDRPS